MHTIDCSNDCFHQYRAKVTGYSPAPNRYFVRRTAPVGKVSTTNWNEQKAKVTGYTAPSNQYFATRARLAYHPADKTFGGFSGELMKVEGVTAQAEQAPTPEPPKPKVVPFQKDSNSKTSFIFYFYRNVLLSCCCMAICASKNELSQL